VNLLHSQSFSGLITDTTHAGITNRVREILSDAHDV